MAVGVAAPEGGLEVFAPNKPPPPNKFPAAAGADAAGVVEPEVVEAGAAPKRDVVVVLFGSVELVPVAGAAGAAGFAPKLNKLPPAGGAAAGVVLPLALPKRLGAAGAGVPGAPCAAGLAPNNPPLGGAAVKAPSAGFGAPKRLLVPGGGAAGVVDCPKPPKRGLEAGVVDPAGVPPEVGVEVEVFPKPPNRFPPLDAAGAGVEEAAGCCPNEKEG